MLGDLSLTPEVPICIYGAGEVGQKFATRIRQQGYKAIAFFDRKLVGKHCNGLPVLDYLSPLPDNLSKSQVVTVICLADGMEHMAVADALYSAGFSYIVLLPMELPIAKNSIYALTRLYNQVLEVQNNLTVAVADYGSLRTPDLDPEHVILRREGERLTVLMDAIIVFSEDYSVWKGDITKTHGDARYSDVNIIICDFCFPLFAYLSGGTASHEKYLAAFTNNLDRLHLDIVKRNQLYDIYCRELDRGLDFFIESAASAEWSSKGYFNLVGGHHRTSFLVFREHKLLPLRISEVDFARWCNHSCLKKIRDELSANSVQSLYAPVPHPAFQTFPAYRESRLPSIYSALYRYLGVDGLAGKSVIDLCDDEGYFARLLYRLKAEKVTAYAPSAAKAELTTALNELLYMPQIHVAVGDPTPNDSCSFLVVMDRATGLAVDERLALIKQADALCTGRMLWESYAEDFDADCQAIYAHSAFKHCEILLHVVLDGRRRTAAVFSK
ncbi:MAG: nucleoside-diphosphate sugar epimerase/dehydratase [Desulfobulbus sp.]|jgi:hypothetical protein